jgi:O-antigen biosynthesis protein
VKQFSLIVPVLDHVEYTRRFIRQVPSLGLNDVEIIWCDRSSTNGSVEVIKDSGIGKYISVNADYSYGATLNAGIEHATSDILVFIRPDVIFPESDWLHSIQKAFDSANVGIASVTMIDSAGNPIVTGITYNGSGTFDSIGIEQDVPDGHQLIYASEACIACKKALFEHFGLFDPKLKENFAYVDFIIRAMKATKHTIVHEAFTFYGADHIEKMRAFNSDRAYFREKHKIFLHEGARTPETETPLPLTSIIILTSNQLEYTKKCVKSVQRHTPEDYEIIFVDNGSTDGTKKWLRKLVAENKHYRLIENREHVGFAKGWNQGIEESRGEYILLLNNGVVVAEGWLSGLLDCLKHAPSAGIVGPMTHDVSGPQRVISEEYRSVDSLNKFSAQFREKYRHRRIAYRNIASFCMLFRRSLVEEIGKLDESFGTSNDEDDDFCLRAALAGYQNYIAGDVFIHHFGDRGSIGNDIDYSSAPSGNKKSMNTKWTLSSQSETGTKLAVLRATEKAGELYAKGKTDEAVAALIDCIKISPDAAEIYYMLTRIFIESKKFSEAWDVIKSMPDAVKNDVKGLEYAGYVKEGLGMYSDADDSAEDILSRSENYPAALNLKGLLAYKKGEREKAADYYTRALEADEGYGEAHTALGVLYWGMDRREEALAHFKKGFILSPVVPDVSSFYYSAVSSLGIFSEAEADFHEASRLYPGNKNIAFLSIDILIQQGKFHEAIIKIEDALALFGVDEGTLNAALAIREKVSPLSVEKGSKRKTVSFCMIVKNEEKNLVKCLRSIRDIADEIIIVDTGSTDRTKDIARVFGARVFDFPWTGNFSDARNHSLNQATGDWIFVLDADEVISPRDFDELKQLIRRKSSSPVAYSIVTRNYVHNVSLIGWTPNSGQYPEEAATGWFKSAKVRLFPRRRDVFFSNPVHELVEHSLQRAKIPVSPCKVIVHHYGKLDKEREAQKDEEYYLLGKMKYESDPTNMKYMYELAKQAQVLGKYGEAVGLWLKLLSRIEAGPQSGGYKEMGKVSYDDLKSEIYIQLAAAYLSLDRYEEALDTARKAMRGTVKRKEYVHVYAHCEIIAGSLETAFEVLEELLKTMPDYAPALLLTAIIFSLEGKKEEAQHIFQTLSSKRVEIAPTLNKFAKQLHAHGKKDEALVILTTAMENHLQDGETEGLMRESRRW